MEEVGVLYGDLEGVVFGEDDVGANEIWEVVEDGGFVWGGDHEEVGTSGLIFEAEVLPINLGG